MSMSDYIKLRDTAIKAYQDGNPIMSDQEYDALELKIGEQAIGGTLDPSMKSAKHTYPMGSLLKAQTRLHIDKWIKSLGVPAYPLAITEKMDGVSCSASYVDGILINALTRGDCIYGEDITENFVRMKGAKRKLPVPFTGSLIGEIIIRRSDFHNFEGASNPRNSAAGAAKATNDRSKAQFCSVIFYKAEPRLESRLEDFKFLKSLGLTTPTFLYAKKSEGIDSIYERYIESTRKDIDYDIDGLVVEIDNRDLAYSVGTDYLLPEYAIAYKFPSDEGETTLRSVIWQTGRTGVITPVAVFDPVLLAGASVERANIATLDLMIEKNLTVGARIVVSRRNDVIPMVERYISGGNGIFNIPKSCPSCGSTLRKDKKRIYCINTFSCKAQVVGTVVNYTTKLGVLEWGEENVAAIYSQLNLMGLFDIYYIGDISIAECKTSSGKFIGRKTASSMISNLSSKTNLKLANFIGALGIPGISTTLAQTLVENGYDTIDKMCFADEDDLKDIDGFGESRALDFTQYMSSMSTSIFNITREIINIESISEGPLSGKSFCLTGFRDAELSNSIQLLGGTVKNSVSKDLTYLVQKANKASTKTEKANSLGIKIISYEQAVKMTKENAK